MGQIWAEVGRPEALWGVAERSEGMEKKVPFYPVLVDQ
jgi:hypothetical protein